jgi:hypothetical protein
LGRTIKEESSPLWREKQINITIQKVERGLVEDIAEKILVELISA